MPIGHFFVWIIINKSYNFSSRYTVGTSGPIINLNTLSVSPLLELGTFSPIMDAVECRNFLVTPQSGGNMLMLLHLRFLFSIYYLF